MIIELNGKEMEVEPHYVKYPNDILEGCLLDMPENYLFLSDHVDQHRDIMADLGEIPYYDMSDAEVDYDKPPHSWCVISVGKLIVATAEALLEPQE